MSAADGSERARSGSRSRRLGVLGAVLLGGLVVAAVAAPLLAPYEPGMRVGAPFAAPSLDHLLGTDDVGHDILSQLVFGTRVTLLVGVVAAAAATVVGTALGLVAGYVRGWVDALIMRLVDVVLSMPFLPLMIVVGVFLGPGTGTQILVIAAVMWAGAAREIRSQVLSLREREHVLAARSMGAGTPWVLRRHVAPAVVPIVVPQFVLAAKRAILFEAALSFLGLGSAGAVSWGTMLFNAHARSAFLTDAWLWWVLPPGIAIATAVLSFAFIGYGLEERARPQLRTRSRPRVLVRAPARPDAPPADAPALEIEELTVAYDAPDGGPVVAVDGLDLRVTRGEVVGLVGESGAGKSTVALAAAALLRPPARIVGGAVRVAGRDLLGLPARALRAVRGGQVGFIPQDAMGALNPVFRVGDQVAEAVTLHRDLPRGQVDQRVRTLLEQVGLDPGCRRSYPHELSGGMRQRAVIAMALANEPALVVADEPTSGVDVVLQAEIVALLERLRRELGMAMLVVSHDLPLVLRLSDRVAVMRRGEVVERAPAAGLASRARHDHTRELLAAVPRLPTGEAVG